MNSNSLSSGPASIPDFAPLTDAFDMTPTPSEADAMSVRATVSMEVKANAIKNKKKKRVLDVFIWLVAQGKTLTVIGNSVLIFNWYSVGVKPDKRWQPLSRLSDIKIEE